MPGRPALIMQWTGRESHYPSDREKSPIVRIVRIAPELLKKYDYVWRYKGKDDFGIQIGEWNQYYHAGKLWIHSHYGVLSNLDVNIRGVNGPNYSEAEYFTMKFFEDMLLDFNRSMGCTNELTLDDVLWKEGDS